VRLSGEFQPEMTVVIESEDGGEVIMEEPVMMEEVVVEEVIEEDVLEEDGEIVAEEETAVLEVEEVTEA
jgi:hypothetical protein